MYMHIILANREVVDACKRCCYPAEKNRVYNSQDASLIQGKGNACLCCAHETTPLTCLYVCVRIAVMPMTQLVSAQSSTTPMRSGECRRR